MTVVARKYIFILLFISLPTFVFAEINVNITPVELVDGMAQIESMVNTETADAAEEIENLLKTFTEKPLLFSSMAAASSVTSLLLPFTLPQPDNISSFTGTSASFCCPENNIAALSEQLTDFSIEQDLEIGADLQTFTVYLGLPGDFLFSGLMLFLGAGFMTFDYEEIFIESSNFHMSASYTFFSYAKNALVTWSGLRLQGGFSLFNSKISTVYPLEEITQTFPIDPDGAGPIVPFSVTISLTPAVGINFKTTGLSSAFALSSGIVFLETFSLHAGLGTAISLGGNFLGIDVDENIEVQGFLSDLVATAPVLQINGEEQGGICPFFIPFAFGVFSFSIGEFYLNIPVSFNINKTFSAGLSIGALF